MRSISKWILVAMSLSVCLEGLSQTNDLTNSPYSRFGLGIASNASTGSSSGLGYTGIGRLDRFNINISNPASYAALLERAVILDIGGSVSKNYLVNNYIVNAKTSGNFSNLSLAIKPSARFGLGLNLIPSTIVGYTLLGLEASIQGSTDTYKSDVSGSGGINKLSLSGGYQFTTRLAIGASLSYLFGRVDEQETIYLGESPVWDILYINDINYYDNFEMSLGLQYQAFDNLSFGLTTKLPTTLIGKQDRNIQKRVDYVTTTIDEIENQDTEDFHLPFQVGLGISSKLNNQFYLFGDYEAKFWNATDQVDGFGEYTNQHLIKLGLQYQPKNSMDTYWGKLQYNVGVLYDTGYLSIKNSSVNNRGVSLGLGLPIGKKGGSYIHLGYQYQKNGSVEGILIEENRNIFSINISLLDIWFMKSYID